MSINCYFSSLSYFPNPHKNGYDRECQRRLANIINTYYYFHEALFIFFSGDCIGLIRL